MVKCNSSMSEGSFACEHLQTLSPDGMCRNNMQKLKSQILGRQKTTKTNCGNICCRWSERCIYAGQCHILQCHSGRSAACTSCGCEYSLCPELCRHPDNEITLHECDANLHRTLMQVLGFTSRWDPVCARVHVWNCCWVLVTLDGMRDPSLYVHALSA